MELPALNQHTERVEYRSAELQALVLVTGRIGMYEKSLALHERGELRTMALDMFFDERLCHIDGLALTLEGNYRGRAFPSD